MSKEGEEYRRIQLHCELNQLKYNRKNLDNEIESIILRLKAMEKGRKMNKVQAAVRTCILALLIGYAGVGVYLYVWVS